MAALLLAAAVLTSCNNQTNNPSESQTGGETVGETVPETKKQETEPQETKSEEETYKRNPKLTGAYSPEAKTVRVTFEREVYCPEFDFKDYAYVAASPESSEKIACTGFYLYNPRWDSMDNQAYFTVADLYFESELPKDAYLCFTENEATTDNDGALNGFIEDANGKGLYAATRQEGKTPVASVKIDSTEIKAPEIETRLLFAYYADPEEGLFVFTFSKPVTVAEKWGNHLFLANCANPDPATPDFWQYNADAVCLDPHEGADGKTYGTTYAVYFKTEDDIPLDGVLRFSENDAGAGDEYINDPTNVDLGRIIWAEDGTPLMGTDTTGWDVAHCRYYTKNLWDIQYTLPEAPQE